ncbi:MAG: hypothetical protein IPM94_09340 [bacterium]|nr:hypothetical protein [bacterium]
MFLGRVIGTLVATTACEGMAGVPLLWVQPLGSDGEPAKGSPSCARTGRGWRGPGRRSTGRLAGRRR